jgi:RND family efflux transporter MFP subunit
MIARPLAVLAVLGLLAAAPALAGGGTPPPPKVSVAKPVVKEIQEWDDFIGRFEAVDQVDVRARVSGYLDRVLFQDGALVKAGDRLFTIDPRPYRNTAQQAEAAVASAQSRVEFAQGDLERAESLRRTGNIAEQLLDQRRQTFLTAQADLNSAQAQLRQGQLDLDFTEIKAPINGRVSRKLVTEGGLINANETVLTNIVSLDPIYFYFDVDERSFLAYARMQTSGGQTSTGPQANDVMVATTDQTEPTLKGKLDFLDNRLDAQSGTIRARGVFENDDLFLTPGLFGRIRVLGSERYKGVLVPDEAVGADQDRRVVYAVGAENKVSLKPVRLGPRIDGYRVIREGLSGDDVIVVNGLSRVRPGQAVDPQVTQLPPTRERDGS